MNKFLLAIIGTSFLLLTGCSSSGGTNDGENVVDRPEPVDPEFGLNVPSIPDIENTPDWGLDVGNVPDRLPPIWGGPLLTPDIDNGPVGYTISGNTITDIDGNTFMITKVDWHGQAMVVHDKEGNEYYVQTIRQGDNEGDFSVFFNGKAINISGDAVQGGPRPLMEGSERAIDRNTIRDSIRSRLN